VNVLRYFIGFDESGKNMLERFAMDILMIAYSDYSIDRFRDSSD
jgi:hypothetical protein